MPNLSIFTLSSPLDGIRSEASSTKEEAGFIRGVLNRLRETCGGSLKGFEWLSVSAPHSWTEEIQPLLNHAPHLQAVFCPALRAVSPLEPTSDAVFKRTGFEGHDLLQVGIATALQEFGQKRKLMPLILPNLKHIRCDAELTGDLQSWMEMHADTVQSLEIPHMNEFIVLDSRFPNVLQLTLDLLLLEGLLSHSPDPSIFPNLTHLGIRSFRKQYPRYRYQAILEDCSKMMVLPSLRVLRAAELTLSLHLISRHRNLVSWYGSIFLNVGVQFLQWDMSAFPLD
jgi:hypothetical protein